MRIVTIRIEDNSGKIDNVKALESEKEKRKSQLLETIDRLQEDAFLQILAYVRCAYEDYVGIVGKTTKINEVSWMTNRLDVSNLNRSVSICADEEGVIIDFNYSGTLNCKDTPPRMEAKFGKDKIVITKSTRNGICDLMRYWKDIKPLFQEKIDKAYEKKLQEIKSERNDFEYLLNVAEQFKI